MGQALRIFLYVKGKNVKKRIKYIKDTGPNRPAKNAGITSIAKSE
jgi:hypothetical protein